MSDSAEAWARLLAAGSARWYEPGAALLRQGEPATHVLALVSGRVKILYTSQEGQILILALRGPGEILGDMSVLGVDDRSATVVALDRCETRLILADRFLLLVRSLGLEEHFLRHAMSRIRESDAWRAELATLPAAPRLARMLSRLAEGSPTPAEVRMDQAELGHATGLSRSTVAAELARLREQGVVSTSRRRIIITNSRRLQALSQPDHDNV